MSERDYSPADRCLIGIDQALRTLFGQPQVTERPDPSRKLPETDLSDQQRTLMGRLMRINHAGEVCAQALYQGQALTARLPEVRHAMERAAQEENDHLDWCARRLDQLGSHRSLLNPLWYLGSFAIGAAAGLAGDRWSLGFVVETERQVEAHLDSHLDQVPDQDLKTRAILEQMREDEIRHASLAQASGGAEFPLLVKQAMGLASQVMTRTTYWL
jgi:ubiquinone biosynthesis monooxygenase Coq7